MKIIQSCWSCNQEDLLKFNAGWYSPEYHIMGWALSCLQLKKFYKDVELFCDSKSANILIDYLKLPYTNYTCNLDKLRNINPNLFAYAKLTSYSIQQSPFLHIDGDVFIFSEFNKGLLNSDLIAQNLEIATDNYRKSFQKLEQDLTFLPREIIAEKKRNQSIYAFNAGIIGGKNLAFFDLYTKKAFQFISRNTRNLTNINLTTFNIFFEQYFFYCLAKGHNKEVNVLLKEIIPDDEYSGFGDFNEVPFNKQYLHLIGPFKRSKTICEQMASRLREDYPEYYYRIIALFKNKQVRLKKDYYYFINSFDEQGLTERYLTLKEAYRKNELTVTEKSIKLGNRTPVTIIIKDLISKWQLKSSNDPTEPDCSLQLKDLENFGAKLAAIEKKFEAYSKDYLYSRDLTRIQYFQFVFGIKSKIYDKVIIADPIIEIIESQFDWREIDSENINTENLIQQLNATPTIFYTCLVPECDSKGYSMINIDNLDVLLLQIAQMPVTIGELLNKIKVAFDEDDLRESLSEFETLIIGRVKLALEAKLIKAVL